MKVIFDEAHATQRKEEYDAKLNSAKGKIFKFVNRRYIGDTVSLAIVLGYFIGMLYCARNNVEYGAWLIVGGMLLLVVLQQVFIDESNVFFKTPLEVVYLDALMQVGERPTLILEKDKDGDTCLIKLETEKEGVREAKEIGEVKIKFCSLSDIDEQTLDFTKEVIYLPFVDCEELSARITVNDIK